MSSSLVEQRRNRIRHLRSLIKDQTIEARKNGEDGWIDKNWILSVYMVNSGVRERLVLEYYQILLNMCAIEETEKLGTTLVRSLETH